MAKGRGKAWAEWWGAHGHRADTVVAVALSLALVVAFSYVFAGSRPLDATYMFERWCALTKRLALVEGENAALEFYRNATGNFTRTEFAPVRPSNYSVTWADEATPTTPLVAGVDYRWYNLANGTLEILNATVSGILGTPSREARWLNVTYLWRPNVAATIGCNGAFWALLGPVQLSLFATVIAFLAGLPIGFLVGWARTLRTESLAALRARIALPKEPMDPRRRALLRLRAGGLVLLAGGRRLARRIADGYVEVMRGTPLFLQILFVWYLLLVKFPTVANLALLAGVLAMVANQGGYQGEIFRAGLQTVHGGQIEAARAIGLSRWGAMRNVVLPQALRLVIPPLTNEFIGLFKASALLFFIGVRELTFTFKQLANFESRIFELFALVTLLYLVVTIPVGKGVEVLERRYRIPGLGIQAVRTPLGRARRTAGSPR